MLKTRIAVGAFALAAAVVLPAAALAAGDTLKVTGPTHVKTGHAVTLAIRGHTAHKTQLSVFLDSKACAANTSDEAARATASRPPLFLKSVNGRFRDTVTFKHSTTGTHYICAYLYDSGTKVGPDRRATHKYVTH